jgi:precorrin-6B C5,15-methyltransferase / cobalt-precorrin-6B C5,C15-methyltransferase
MMTHRRRSAVDTEPLEWVAEGTGGPAETISAAGRPPRRATSSRSAWRWGLAPFERLCRLAVATSRAHVSDQLAEEVLLVDFEVRRSWPVSEKTATSVVSVIGVGDDRLGMLAPEAQAALRAARVVVGGRRHLAVLELWGVTEAAPELLEITADTAALVGSIRARVTSGAGPVCVLASGDPGFFGIVRTLLSTLDRRQLRVYPAVTSVAAAFARVGLPWDDAVVVSAHGRPLADVVLAARTAAKAAVLTSPESPPEALGAALVEAGCSVDLAAVCSRLGTAEESVRELSLDELAGGSFDPLSVVVLVGPGGLPLTGWRASGGGAADDRVLAWGRSEATYLHRNSMITKAETRAVILAKLGLPRRGVLWDVGAGSGGVGIECALLSPGLTVFAIESDPESAERIGANAATAGVGVHVVCGSAPEALADLPSPDRAFVGGGGKAVLEAVVDRRASGSHVVASYASLDRALEAGQMLGHLIQVRADRGERLADGSWRFVANNPVFVAWGPEDEASGA